MDKSNKSRAQEMTEKAIRDVVGDATEITPEQGIKIIDLVSKMLADELNKTTIDNRKGKDNGKQ